jgi:hypothetical protein
MPSFQRFPVSASFDTKTINAKTTETLISNKMMCIERMPSNKVFLILGQQTNTKATYCLYLEMNDPNLPQHTNVKWEMYGKSYSGKVKFIQPYSQIVMNRKAECYIQSDNE